MSVIEFDKIVKNVAIVDDDDLILKLVSGYVSALGAESVDCYASAESFWEAHSGGKACDLLILDWKLPGLNGVGLFNRLRIAPSTRMLPILAISGFLNKNDFALLDECPCTSLLEKPFTKALLDNRLVMLAREKQWYDRKQKTIEQLTASFDNDPSAVVKFMKKVFTESPRPIPLAILAAKSLRKRQLYKEARSILELVLKRDETSVMAMSEMGKVLFLMGKSKEARKILQKTHRISPENVQRLCLLGEVELNLHNPESAQKHFQEALEIDPDDHVATSGVVVAKNLKTHLIDYASDTIPLNFASLLNIIGVTKVRSGSFQEGINQYKAALAFLTQDDVVAKVSFNLGLGFMRWRKPEMALPWFIKSANCGSSHFAKSTAYIKRISPNNVPIHQGASSSNQDSILISELEVNDTSSKIARAEDSAPEERPETIDPSPVQAPFDLGLVGEFLGGAEKIDLENLESLDEGLSGDSGKLEVKAG